MKVYITKVILVLMRTIVNPCKWFSVDVLPSTLIHTEGTTNTLGKGTKSVIKNTVSGRYNLSNANIMRNTNIRYVDKFIHIYTHSQDPSIWIRKLLL